MLVYDLVCTDDVCDNHYQSYIYIPILSQYCLVANTRYSAPKGYDQAPP